MATDCRWINISSNAPDASEALVAFAKKFPDLLGPALTGVTLTMEGLDTTMNKTLKDDGKEATDILKKGLDDVDNSADKIEKKLLKAAKAAQKASQSMSDLGGSLAKLNDIPNFLKDPMEAFKKAQEEAAELKKLTDITGTSTKELLDLWSGKDPRTKWKGFDHGGGLDFGENDKQSNEKGGNAWTAITTGLNAITPAMDKAKSSIVVGSGQIKANVDTIPPSVGQ